MKRSLLALVLIALPACGPYGLPGDFQQAAFETDKLCADCRYLRAHVVGGRYSVGVGLLDEVCPGEGWSVDSGGTPSTFTLADDEWACSGTLRFTAESVGPLRLTARDADGNVLDTIGLSVVEPERLAIVRATYDPWTSIDAPTLRVPQGLLVEVEAVASTATSPARLDRRLVTWALDGDAAELRRAFPWDDAIRVYAAREGTSTLTATLPGLDAALAIEVVPANEADPESSLCRASAEICDGVDNNCDGVVDEIAFNCWVDGSNIITCEDGACVNSGCMAGFADCDGDELCEASLSDPTSCGACGVTCGDAEMCEDGVCVAMAP